MGTRQLLSDGDRVLAHRDGRELAAIARKLSRRVGDPLSDELLALALVCGRHVELAESRWPTLRMQVAERLAIAGT